MEYIYLRRGRGNLTPKWNERALKPRSADNGGSVVVNIPKDTPGFRPEAFYRVRVLPHGIIQLEPIPNEQVNSVN